MGRGGDEGEIEEYGERCRVKGKTKTTMERSFISPVWSPLKKAGFRFAFIFFSLIIIIQNNGAYPFWELLMQYPTTLLHKFIPWVGKHILHLSYDITVFTNGSGDTTYDYVVVFVILVTAAIGAIVWTLADNQRKNYQTLYYWLTVAIRYYVALMLINYGLFKIIKLQFPYPDFSRLTETYGDSSPMGLAWTFLGFSKGYNLFMGFAEVAAILLLFRRTMTFGAIITLMTAANVMAVNYFYDVPVKILSTTLVLMSLFLLLRDADRIFRFFMTGQAVSLPSIKAPAFSKKWMRIARISLKALIIGYCLIFIPYQLKQSEKQYGDKAPKPKLYGLYKADTFIRNNDTLPPLTTDAVRWKALIIEWEDYASVQYMTGSTSYYTTAVDTVARKIDFRSNNDTSLKYTFLYNMPSPGRLEFNGVIQKDSVHIVMTRKDKKDFELTGREFNWINEYPYNR